MSKMGLHDQFGYLKHKGEGGGFPQVQAMVSLVNPCVPVTHPCTKKGSNYALTNLLFGLCE
jgi:hypothetical protein